MVIAKTYGRMGNYLFQVAATIGYALRNKIPYSVPITTTDPKNNPIYLQHMAHPAWNDHLPEVRIGEQGHAYQDLPYKPIWKEKNIVLDGYWQSEKYFKDVRVHVLDAFGYGWVMRSGVVAIHVRRGDYLRLTQKHPKVTKEWYEMCMAQFPDHCFKFFSDDIEWCRQNFHQRGDVTFSTNTCEEHDLIEMSCCEHQISSSSTFSWWGAWLNQNPDKRILIPKRWFTPREEAKCCTADIVPVTWERL